MKKYSLLSIITVLSISAVCFAKKTDLSNTKWICTVNNSQNNASIKKNDPAKKQIIDNATEKNDPANPKNVQTIGDKLANSSLANAFALAVKKCNDCTDIHCVMQK